jgi:aryl-alcohol dehydrogenase-like predicted oxidoreductase
MSQAPGWSSFPPRPWIQNKSGVKPTFALGTWSLGGDYYRPIPPLDSNNLISTALDRGIQRFDTAPVYGGGHAELLLGQIIRRYSRQHSPQITPDLHITSKVFAKKPSAIRSSLKKSLRRLGRDHLDCLLLHWPSIDGSLEESWQTILSLKKAGLIAEAGLSNIGREQFSKLEAIGKPDVLQRGFNLLFRHEGGWLEDLSHKGIKIQAYSPLCQGLLGPRYLEEGPTDRRQIIWPFQKPFVTKIRRALKDALVETHLEGQDLLGLGLAWLKSQDWLFEIIIGPKNSTQLLQLLDSEPAKFTEETLVLFERKTAFLVSDLADKPHLFSRHLS